MIRNMRHKGGISKSRGGANEEVKRNRQEDAPYMSDRSSKEGNTNNREDWRKS